MTSIRIQLSIDAIVASKFFTLARQFAGAMAVLTLTCAGLSALSAPADGAHLTPGFFHQRVDHGPKGRQLGYFRQRFWTDSEFAEGPSSPTLLRLCGEFPCEHFMPDATIEHAKILHAHIIYLEHRYYGKSQPFADLNTNNLRYLTLRNVMADIASFQKSYAEENRRTGKWIAIGGSYSGTLAAMYRQRHPELVVGALASSAPMFRRSFRNIDYLWQSILTATEPSDDLGIGVRAWTYQACTELGFFGAWPIRPFVVETVDQKICKSAFGDYSLTDELTYNNSYFYPFVRPGPNSVSHILFTTGANDPWREISISKSNNGNSEIVPYFIEGAGHHFDLIYLGPQHDLPSVKAARALFIELATKWLKE
jgi:pimeloyl-ACP methyl ester carboxylesterase